MSDTKMIRGTIFFLLFACGMLTLATLPCTAQDDNPKQEPATEHWLDPIQLKQHVIDILGEAPNAKKLLPDGRLWINRDEQAVIVDGYICQRQAQLEMFACPVGSKEHESVVAVYCRSRFVHAALEAVNAQPGKPATFEPFVPASGTTIRVYALWHDEHGKTQGTIAQRWVRQSGTNKSMKWDWVFAGSKLYKDEATGEKIYLADSGELICVANFGTSTLDVAVRSNSDNSGLLFDTYTERIPKRDTPIRLVLVLSDDAPNGTDGEEEDKEPAFLNDKVPDSILQFLPDRKDASSKKDSDDASSKTNGSKPATTTPDTKKTEPQKSDSKKTETKKTDVPKSDSPKPPTPPKGRTSN